MAKGYWICFYRSISNPAALAEYARLAGPAIQTGGGRFLARGTPAKIYEAGKDQRTVIIEFDTVKQATATYESNAYQSAVRRLTAWRSGTFELWRESSNRYEASAISLRSFVALCDLCVVLFGIQDRAHREHGDEEK